jgi:hypothetical protein
VVWTRNKLRRRSEMLGGILAGALGGGARAAGQIADSNIAFNQRKQLIEQEMERKRQEAEEMDKRLLDGFDKAREGGAALGRQSDATALQGLGSQTQGDAPVMSSDEIQKLLAENPQYRSVYEGAGLLASRPDSEEYALQAQAAREAGAPAEVRKELNERSDRYRTAERQAAVDAETKRRNEEIERIRAAQQATADARLEELVRANQTREVQRDREIAVRENPPPRPSSGSGPELNAEQKSRQKRVESNLAAAEKMAAEAELEARKRPNDRTKRQAAEAEELRMRALQEYNEFWAINQGRAPAPAPAPPPVSQNGGQSTSGTPPVNLLQSNKVTTFANGQKWTLKDGKAVQVK